MARLLNRLTARKVSTAGRGKYSDGGGLWLQVTPSGGKSWGFRYTRAGREHFMGLGPTHTVTLARARDDAAAARLALRDGLDPMEHRRRIRAEREGIPTFSRPPRLTSPSTALAGETPSTLSSGRPRWTPMPCRRSG